MEKVTLYIPCFNAAAYIGPCIESALKQEYPVDEVLVIDDGSLDSTCVLAGAYPVRIIRHGANRGLAAARNTAFTHARNDFVAGLDADCRPQKEWLGVLMRSFADPRVAGAGGRLIETNTCGLADQWRSIHMKQHWGSRRIEDPPFLFGSNTVLRRGPVERAGLYDPRYTTNREDLAMSLALKKSGFTLVYDPGAVVYHVRRDSIGSLLATHWRWSFFGTAGLRRPDSVYNLACRLYDRSCDSAGRMFRDFMKARAGCVALDALMYFHHGLADIRYWRRAAERQP